MGHDRLFIKRDDMTGLGQGGNKTRSLEFLLGDALSKGANAVITAGGLQSNLCSLTAAACARYGLRCILVHNDDPPQMREGNMLLNAILGAEERFVGRTDEAARTAAMEDVAVSLRSRGERPYIIYNGASTPLGAMGYVSGAFELHRQCADEGIPLKHVGMVGAMGGTAGGFVFGTAVLGHPFHVHVISVEYPKEVLLRLMKELFAGLADLTGVSPVMPPEEVMTIYDEYLGAGYAVPTELSRRTLLDLARTEGILIENVYTSKTLGGFGDLIRRGMVPAGEAACYVHTGGLGSLFAQNAML
jgi:1-aminocyclopropane-1-carboxylate deaminase/D-cysteine desulfhydrase-like pyridoxal-dependent ACC family enzyme